MDKVNKQMAEATQAELLARLEKSAELGNLDQRLERLNVLIMRRRTLKVDYENNYNIVQRLNARQVEIRDELEKIRQEMIEIGLKA